MKERRIIGLMSGTSLDGLDMACVQFSGNHNDICFSLIAGETVPLPLDIKKKLIHIELQTPRAIFQLNSQLALFFAESVNDFISKHNLKKSEIDAIASHGQTIFHQPENGYTVQLGCGSTLAYNTGLPVINDFRSLDVAAGGQGAPLVPLGDLFLFGNLADSFINIGGFTNISFNKGGPPLAFDICPGNLPLNKYARILGHEYDEDGSIAAINAPDQQLLDTLNNLPYYHQKGPKSLGTEWLESDFYPCIPIDISPETAIATLTQHIVHQTVRVLKEYNLKQTYITGGGALNTYLIQQIQSNFKGQLVIPSIEIIQFKEAIVFAFLGLRFLNREHNSLASVTGAKENVCGGSLHLPK